MSSSKKQYPQKFRHSWLTDPLLKGWLKCESVIGKEGVLKRPKCIYCKQIMCVRYKDLVKHATTSKHLRNSGQSVIEETLSEATFAEASEEEESEDPNIDIDYTTDSVAASGSPVYSSKRKLNLLPDGTVEVVEGEEQTIAVADDNDLYASEMQQLKLERMRVELEQERVRLYTLKLEALRVETQLGRPRSEFTCNL